MDNMSSSVGILKNIYILLFLQEESMDNMSSSVGILKNIFSVAGRIDG